MPRHSGFGLTKPAKFGLIIGLVIVIGVVVFLMMNSSVPVTTPSGFVATSDNTTGFKLKSDTSITDYSKISSVPPGTVFSGTNLSNTQQKIANNFSSSFGAIAANGVYLIGPIVAQWYSQTAGPMGGPIFKANTNDTKTGPDNSVINAKLPPDNSSWDKFINNTYTFYQNNNTLTGTSTTSFDNTFIPPLNTGSALVKSMERYTVGNISAQQLANNLTSSLTPINGGIWTVVSQSSPNAVGGIQYIMELNPNKFAQYCTN